MGFVLVSMSAILLAAAADSAQGSELTLCLKKQGGNKATITTPYDLGFGDVLDASTAEFFLDTSGGDFSIIGTPAAGNYHIDRGACSRSSISMPDVDSAFACAGQPSAGLPGVWAVTERNVFASLTSYAPGYWTPYALAGAVPGGNNLGSYHLICYLPPGMKETGGFIRGDGNAVPAAYPFLDSGNPIPGVYRVIG